MAVISFGERKKRNGDLQLYNCSQDGESRDELSLGNATFVVRQGNDWPMRIGQAIAAFGLPESDATLHGRPSRGIDRWRAYQECLRELRWSQRTLLEEVCCESISRALLVQWAQQYVDRLLWIDGFPSPSFHQQEDAAGRLVSGVADWLESMLRKPPSDERDAARCFQVGCWHSGLGITPLRLQIALLELRRQVQSQLRTGDSPTGALTDADVSALAARFDLEAALVQESFRMAEQQREQREQRLVALRQIAAEIAGDLRSPLNVLMTSAHYLVRQMPLKPEKLGEQLGQMHRQAEALETKIRSLQDFASLPSSRPQSVDLAKLLQQTVDEQNLPSDVKVVMQLDASLPKVSCDADQVAVMMEHLIRNAKEAMPNGGTLRLTLEPTGGKARLLVGDTGVGIARPDLLRIKEPLFTTKMDASGLGLAICEAVVQRHDGCLSVTSRLDWGSEFVVDLPLESASLQGEEFKCVTR